ncbi:MAG: hypothetical protein AB7V14_04985 [Kiritimatiellia bacterium]
MAVGLALAGAWQGKAARAGLETFETAGLGSNWVDIGSFTGQEGIAWTYANACGIPTVYADDPAIVLQTGYSANKGWLLSGTITGGCARVSAVFKQVLSDAVDCVVLVNGIEIANYRSSGGEGSVEEASFDAYDSANRMPFTNDFTLMVSNRLASGGRVAIDNLAWEPFRLFVRLDRTGTNLAYAGREFDAEAEVFAVGEAVTGGWRIEPAFAGERSDTNSLQITLVPAEEDVGQTFTVAYAATDPEGTGYVHQADFQMSVLGAPNPRFVDFEGAAFGYDTNSGVATNLNGMDWTFFNVQTSDSTDRKIGATSARFRHSSLAAPAIMESAGTFEGVGAISVHGAYYGSNRVVRFEVQTRGEEEAGWTPNGNFSVWECEDITNSLFSFEVQRSEPVRVRLITTGNFGEIADVDDLRISEYGDVPPRLVWSGPTNAPVGWETVLDFTLLNAEGMVRTWDCALAPPNAHAEFTTNAERQLQLRFSPADTNDWGDYAVSVTARFDAAVAGATNVAIRVVSPPAFQLAPVATNVAVTNRVDAWVTNMVLHAGGTDWTTDWNAEPAFANPPTTSDKRRFLINTGTTEADVGAHTVTAVLTDSGTGVSATNAATIWVTSGGGDLTNEVYAILSFSSTQLVVGGKSGRVFRAIGTTNLTEGGGFWQGPEITNADGANLALEITPTPDPRMFFYGVKVRAAP